MSGSLNYRQAEAFHLVMLTGSMTAAAELLDLTQPGVSRLIRDFETKIGFKLFTRNGSNIAPTPEAVTLHREVSRAIDAMSQIERTARDIASKSTSALHVTATIGLASVYLGEALKRLACDFPETSVSVTVGTASQVSQNMSAGGFDLGLAFFPRDVPGLEIRPLGPIDAVCVMPKGHPLAMQEKIVASDLIDVPLICLTRETLSQYQILSTLRSAGVEPKIRIEADLAFLVYQLVKSGLGAAIVEPVTARLLAQDQIVIRPFEPRITFRPGIALPAMSRSREIAETLCDYIHDLFVSDFRPPSVPAGQPDLSV